MNTKVLTAAIACVAFYASGCATVRMGDVAQSTASGGQSQLTVSQEGLRTASMDLIQLCETRGWSAGENVAVAARRTLNVLLHGRSNRSDAPAAPTPAETYLAAHAASGEMALADALAADMADLAVRVTALNAAADAVIADAALDPDTIDDDVRRVESAIQRARAAQALFAAVLTDMRSQMAAEDRSALSNQLSAVSADIAGMSARADALGARRPQTRGDLG